MRLDTITLEYKNILSYNSEINNICSKLHDNSIDTHECLNYMSTVNITVIDIISQTEIFYELIGKPQNQKRLSERALLGVVGEISKQSFGTLAESDAKRFDEELDRVHKNENHLLELLKQHTSVSETTLENFHTVNSKLENFQQKLLAA